MPALAKARVRTLSAYDSTLALLSCIQATRPSRWTAASTSGQRARSAAVSGAPPDRDGPSARPFPACCGAPSPSAGGRELAGAASDFAGAVELAVPAGDGGLAGAGELAAAGWG